LRYWFVKEIKGEGGGETRGGKRLESEHSCPMGLAGGNWGEAFVGVPQGDDKKRQKGLWAEHYLKKKENLRMITEGLGLKGKRNSPIVGKVLTPN